MTVMNRTKIGTESDSSNNGKEEMDIRQARSPYSSKIARIYFGGTPTSLAVHHDLICRYPKLSSLFEGLSVLKLRLKDIPENVGHVIVHFLYTGTFQTLGQISNDPLTDRTDDFRTSVQTYAAARDYELQELQELAKGKVIEFGYALPELSLLDAAKDVHLKPDDDQWFTEYATSRIKPLLESPTSLAEPGFLNHFSDAVSGNKSLAKSVIEMCCRRMATLAGYPAALVDQPAEIPREQHVEQGVQHESELLRACSQNQVEAVAKPGAEEPQELGVPAIDEEDQTCRKDVPAAATETTVNAAVEPEAEDLVESERTASEVEKLRARLGWRSLAKPPKEVEREVEPTPVDWREWRAVEPLPAESKCMLPNLEVNIDELASSQSPRKKCKKKNKKNKKNKNKKRDKKSELPLENTTKPDFGEILAAGSEVSLDWTDWIGLQRGKNAIPVSTSNASQTLSRNPK